MKKRTTADRSPRYQSTAGFGTPSFSPEVQRLKRDLLLWWFIGKDGQKQHGGTFERFQERFRLMTPEYVYDQYKLLTPHERLEFLRKAALISNADSVDVFLNSMLRTDREAYLRRDMHEQYELLLTLVLADAIEIVRQIPAITLDALMEKIRHQEKLVRGISFGALEASAERRMKSSRDRKSNPATIRRNVEICDLRTKDAKTWTQGKLAKKYKLSPQAIRKILSEETKWRQLATALSTN